jgi:hypothetical protein
MRGYKVVSLVELLGFRPGMEEDELIQIVGDHQVHMTAGGYLKLTGSIVNMAESQRATYAGEKRGRDMEEEEEEGSIENYHRRRHDWLYSVVLGAGGWRSGQPVGMGGQERGRGAARGGERGSARGAGRRTLGLGMGIRGGNIGSYIFIS